MTSLLFPSDGNALRSLLGGPGRLVQVEGAGAATVHVAVGDMLCTLALDWRELPGTARMSLACSVLNAYTDEAGYHPEDYAFVPVYDLLIALGCLTAADLAGAIATLSPYDGLEEPPDAPVKDHPARRRARVRQIAYALTLAPWPQLVDHSTLEDITAARSLEQLPVPTHEPRLHALLALLDRRVRGNERPDDRATARRRFTSIIEGIHSSLPDFDPGSAPSVETRVAEHVRRVSTLADQARLLWAVYDDLY